MRNAVLWDGAMGTKVRASREDFAVRLCHRTRKVKSSAILQGKREYE